MRRSEIVFGIAAIGLVAGFAFSGASAETYMDAYGEIPPPRYDYEPSPHPILIQLSPELTQLACRNSIKGSLSRNGCALTFLKEDGSPIDQPSLKNIQAHYLEQVRYIENPGMRLLAREAIKARICVIIQADVKWLGRGYAVHNYRHERGHCNGWRHAT